MSVINSLTGNDKLFTIDEESFVASLTFPGDWFNPRGSALDFLETMTIRKEIEEYEEQAKEHYKKNKWCIFTMLYDFLVYHDGLIFLDGPIKFGGLLSHYSIFPAFYSLSIDLQRRQKISLQMLFLSPQPNAFSPTCRSLT